MLTIHSGLTFSHILNNIKRMNSSSRTLWWTLCEGFWNRVFNVFIVFFINFPPSLLSSCCLQVIAKFAHINILMQDPHNLSVSTIYKHHLHTVFHIYILSLKIHLTLFLLLHCLEYNKNENHQLGNKLFLICGEMQITKNREVQKQYTQL